MVVVSQSLQEIKEDLRHPGHQYILQLYNYIVLL